MRYSISRPTERLHSYSGGTSSHYGLLHTNIGAVRSFGQVDLQRPLDLTDA
jgi:hypothetical protein